MMDLPQLCTGGTRLVTVRSKASSSIEGLVKLSLNSVLAPIISIGTSRDVIEACPK